MDLSKRVATLELRVRFLVLVLAVMSGCAVVMASAYPSGRFSVVRCEQVVVVDQDGKERIRIGERDGSYGGCQILMLDPRGKEAIQVFQFATGGGQIRLYNDDQTTLLPPFNSR